MTYKRMMEKAIKNYLSAFGFKYNPSEDFYTKKVNDDMLQAVGYAFASGGRKSYYHLRIFVAVSSNELNDILYEITNGSVDYRNSTGSPVYINHCDDKMMHMEFCGERSIEENINEFATIFRMKIQKVFDLYNCQKSIFLCPLNEPYFNVLNTPYIWNYVPLAHFFCGEFDEAINYINQRIQQARESEARILSRYGTLEDEDFKTRRSYETMLQNLKKWIAERRQFEVDGEYLPNYLDY